MALDISDKKGECKGDEVTAKTTVGAVPKKEWYNQGVKHLVSYNCKKIDGQQGKVIKEVDTSCGHLTYVDNKLVKSLSQPKLSAEELEAKQSVEKTTLLDSISTHAEGGEIASCNEGKIKEVKGRSNKVEVKKANYDLTKLSATCKRRLAGEHTTNNKKTHQSQTETDSCGYNTNWKVVAVAGTVVVLASYLLFRYTRKGISQLDGK